MRPRYQRAHDIENERAALAKFCAHAKCEAVKLPMEARADSMLVRNGKAKVIVEVKTRRNERLKYSTYMLSQDKYTALCEWESKGFLPVLLVQWTDALGCVRVPVEHVVSIGGRYDRGDPKDVENVVLISTDKFEVIDTPSSGLL